MACETGLSLLGRLTDRPLLDHLFGPGHGGCPSGQQVTAVHAEGCGANDGVLSSFCCDVICNVVLPTAYKGVQQGGCGASLGKQRT
jgi:hypothetical protein